MPGVSDVIADLSAVLFLAGALVVRLGGLLLTVGTGRARSAGSAAWRSLLELAVVCLALALVLPLLAWVPVLTLPVLPAGAELAGALLGSLALASAIGERSTARVGIATALAYAVALIPFGLLISPYLTQLGYVDRSGMSIFVLPAGVLALFAAAVVGPRTGRFARDGSVSVIPPHQMPMMLAGLLVLVLGWALIALTLAASWSGPLAGGPVLLTGVAAGVIGGAAYTRWRFGHIDTGLIVPAVIGSVASVSAGLGVFSPASAVLVGALGGWVSVSLHLRLERRVRLDDVAGLATPFVAGTALGTLAAGIAERLATSAAILPLLDSLFVQLFGLSLFLGAALLIAAVVLLPLKGLTRLRVSDDIEYDGLDLAQLDLNAYPDFQQPTIRSSHMREV